MKCCGQSRKEATMPTTLLSTRKNLNIGTWNVRTMYEAGKTAQVAAEMRRFNLALLGLCETRWIQSGRLRLTTGEIVLYSGHEEDDAPHSEGVALLFIYIFYYTSCMYIYIYIFFSLHVPLLFIMCVYVCFFNLYVFIILWALA